ncbi:hypothetical protein [Leuconostoc pseudomesenteroides]|uniref:hypothetical protein n=1 Tax=Leuconostoc pseudomesenteroides TaxID=33968 RepID=UPI0039EA41D2
MFTYLVTLIMTVSFIVSKALSLDPGSLADWVGSLGTILTVVVAIYIAKKTTKDNMAQSRIDKSIDLYIEDLRAIVGCLSELEHNSFLDTIYRGDVRDLTVTDREDAEKGIIKRDQRYAEIIGYHKMSTIIYRMPEKKKNLFKPFMDDISADLNIVMRMDLTDKKFNDKRFLGLLIKSVDNYGEIRDKVSSEIAYYSVFD